MEENSNNEEKSKEDLYSQFSNSNSMTFFILGLTFVMLGFTNITFLIMGFSFIAIGFAFMSETEKETKKSNEKQNSTDKEDPII